MDREFEALVGFAPLKWQSRLYVEYFALGNLPGAVDVPTGLGKTSVMALWLIARTAGAAVPRRLVYVVDRRAVVDQATAVAEQLRESLKNESQPALIELRRQLGSGQRNARPLAISTLRGQHIDNREWLENPSAPAIIIGTVDMVGSRLLFEGYGVSRKMRPYHAGLLGADALVVLDEAHLVPPFERLLASIADEPDSTFTPRSPEDRALVPRFRLLSLSATGRARPGTVFRLEDRDIHGDDVASTRLSAVKLLELVTLDENEQKDKPERLATVAWELTQDGTASARCLVFCNEREVALKTARLLEKRVSAQGARGNAQVELFVGARRGLERQAAAERLESLGFIAGSPNAMDAPVFLVATSAAEVGVDLDAEHLVCDLVPWERMVQRLGRVNRRGGAERRAEVRVVAESSPEPPLQAVVQLFLEYLPRLDRGIDVSPGALRRLKERAGEEPVLKALMDGATTAAPLRPALTRPLLDAWSMTSLTTHTGRAEVAPWLRGWVDDLPQTRAVWRRHLPIRQGETPDASEALSFFEAAPPHASEVLQTETWRVTEWLVERARALLADHAKPSGVAHLAASVLAPGEPAVCILNASADEVDFLTGNDLAGPDTRAPRVKGDLNRRLTGATLVVDSRLGGLDARGSLQGGHSAPASTLDDGVAWSQPDEAGEAPVVRFRIRARHEASSAADSRPSAGKTPWRPRLRFVLERDDDDVKRWLQVDQWHYDADLEEDRSIARRPQLLDEHQCWAEEEAGNLAGTLSLPSDYAAALRLAARLHDEGKRAKRWQRAFHAPRDADYAKTSGPVDLHLLGGYRHEFGSLRRAERDPRLTAFSSDLQELVLHLIAAHHGHARPVISTAGCEDAPPSALEARARAVALRFVRLQKRWGPWGLAYWESLLRAADQRASRRNDNPDEDNR